MKYDMYEEEMIRLIKSYRPYMPISDIKRAVEYSMNKRYKEVPCVIDNNYTKTQSDFTL